jgi:nucleotide-binding universal stress UspA family protein
VRYGLDNVARANDSCSFACVYKKASQHTPDAGPFMDGTMVRVRHLRDTSETPPETPPETPRHPRLRPNSASPPSPRPSRNTPSALLTVLPAPSHRPSQTETDHKLRVESERLDRRRCEDATRRYAEDAKKAGVAAVSVDVLPAGHGAGGGNVAETIAAYVASKRADLVVVGSRGIGSLQRSVLTLVGLGSVSDYLARHVDAPLLLVRTPARSTAETESRPKESTEAETDESFAPPEGGFARGK